MVLRHLPRSLLIFFLIVVAGAHAAPESGTTPTGAEDATLGSLTPRGTRRVIYNSDLSNTTCHLSELEAKPEELRESYVIMPLKERLILSYRKCGIKAGVRFGGRISVLTIHDSSTKDWYRSWTQASCLLKYILMNATSRTSSLSRAFA